MRRLLAAVIGFVFVLAGARSVDATEPLQLSVGTVGSIGSLDPRIGTGDVAQEVWNLQYPTLTTLAAKTLDPAPGLATAWSPAPNGRGWVYTLRPGATWTDGQPVTADDVVASVERAGGTARILGDGEVEISGNAPGALVNVAPQHVLASVPDLDQDLQALGVGAGPWHVTARTENSVTLDARAEAPALRRIVFRTYPSTDSLLSALDRGEVDVVSGLPSADAERLRALSGVTVNHAPDGTQYLLRNNMTDARLRRAVSLAIDRTELVAKAVDGIGTPGVVPIPARGSAWTLDDATVQELTASLDAQPARARQLVEAAGPGRPVRLLAAGDATSRRVAEYLTGALERVGLRTEIVDGPPYDLLLARRPTTRDSALVDRAEVEQLTRDGRLVGLFEPDTLQAFRSDNVAGWLRTPQVRSLAVFGPTTTQYSQLVAAPPPPGEEASTATYVVGAIGVLGVCAVAFAVAAWIRRRSIA